jgi:hypothetical protein
MTLQAVKEEEFEDVSAEDFNDVATPEKKKEATAMEKFTKNVLRSAKIEEVPELSSLVGIHGGKTMKISDIAIFIGEPKDELLQDVFEKCSILNRVNLSSSVSLSLVKKVAVEILSAGFMAVPIVLARLDDGRVECVSGRHRLVFFALFYGADVEIPYYEIQGDISLSKARQIVIHANEGRKATAQEKAEHVVLDAVSGNADAELDEMYAEVATTKSKAKKYCIYNILRGHPTSISFPISHAGRQGGEGLTTISNIEGFIGNSTNWYKNMTRNDFEVEVANSVSFLNALATEMQKIEGFNPKQHMSNMALKGIANYYTKLEEPMERVGAVASAVVSLGNIGRQPSNETLDQLKKTIKASV